MGSETGTQFDRELYLRNNPDVASAGADPWEHWISFGRDEERRGLRRSYRAPKFDSRYYLRIYPDVARLIENGNAVSAAEHWFLEGRNEMLAGTRAIPPEFDEAVYETARPDVAAAIASGVYANAFDHWLQWGRSEGTYNAEARPASSNLPRMMSAAKVEFWRANGYLILERAITPERCDAINARIDRLWTERRTSTPPISIDIFLERPESSRIPMSAAPGEARALPYKINDLVMHDDDVCSVALDKDVCDVLRWVLDADPVAIGSLNFERGSTQRFHTDTLYMPGRDAGGMTAAWFALEDVTDEAGPLLYYPGSHDIPLYRFSSGGPNQIDGEMDSYTEYMTRNVAMRNLVAEEFLPRRGDVLIWHERLYHGGKPIEDLAQTRKSLVVHYWRENAMPDRSLVPAHGGYFWDRPPL